MAAYAEGLNILHHADAGLRQREVSAEISPLRDPDHYKYELDLARSASCGGAAVWSRPGCST